MSRAKGKIVTTLPESFGDYLRGSMPAEPLDKLADTILRADEIFEELRDQDVERCEWDCYTSEESEQLGRIREAAIALANKVKELV